MSGRHLHGTILNGQEALKRLALALDALQATAKASSQQDHIHTCIDAFRQLEQTFGIMQHNIQQDSPPVS